MWGGFTRTLMIFAAPDPTSEHYYAHTIATMTMQVIPQERSGRCIYPLNLPNKAR